MTRSEWLWLRRKYELENALNRPWFFELGTKRKVARDPEERDEQFRIWLERQRAKRRQPARAG